MHRFAHDQHADSLTRLRQEIALRAARLIAEDGLDYAGAKRRAVRELLGRERVAGEVLPDNAMIEAEVRSYQELFQSDTQPQRLLELRRLAVRLMELLAAFSPVLVGAVANGTASDHTDVHLQLFADSAKDVEMLLLNEGIEFDAEEGRLSHPRHAAKAEEVLHVLWRERGRTPEGVHLSIFTQDRAAASYGGERRAERLNLAALKQLMKAPE
jgi:hypothetical protein